MFLPTDGQYTKMKNNKCFLLRWGIGVFLGMLVSSGVSGGHLNPAVSVALASLGKLSWLKVVVDNPVMLIITVLARFLTTWLPSILEPSLPPVLSSWPTGML